MQHITFRLLLTSIIVIVLIETSTINALFMLFVAGTIPGTNYAVPANTMMLVYCTLICAVLVRVTARKFLRTHLSNYLRLFRDKSKSAPTQATL